MSQKSIIEILESVSRGYLAHMINHLSNKDK